MFNENDKKLFNAEATVLLVSIVLGVIVLVLGIIFMEEGIGVVIWLIGGISVLLFNLTMGVLFSFLYDIKLIRNKLYDLSIDELTERMG